MSTQGGKRKRCVLDSKTRDVIYNVYNFFKEKKLRDEVISTNLLDTVVEATGTSRSTLKKIISQKKQMLAEQTACDDNAIDIDDTILSMKAQNVENFSLGKSLHVQTVPAKQKESNDKTSYNKNFNIKHVYKVVPLVSILCNPKETPNEEITPNYSKTQSDSNKISTEVDVQTIPVNEVIIKTERDEDDSSNSLEDCNDKSEDRQTPIISDIKKEPEDVEDCYINNFCETKHDMPIDDAQQVNVNPIIHKRKNISEDDDSNNSHKTSSADNAQVRIFRYKKMKIINT